MGLLEFIEELIIDIISFSWNGRSALLIGVLLAVGIASFIFFDGLKWPTIVSVLLSIVSSIAAGLVLICIWYEIMRRKGKY